MLVIVRNYCSPFLWKFIRLVLAFMLALRVQADVELDFWVETVDLSESVHYVSIISNRMSLTSS